MRVGENLGRWGEKWDQKKREAWNSPPVTEHRASFKAVAEGAHTMARKNGGDRNLIDRAIIQDAMAEAMASMFLKIKD